MSVCPRISVGAISSAIGSLAALEGVKILSGAGRVMWGRLLTYDGFSGQFSQMNVKPPASPCAVCGMQAKKKDTPCKSD